ncbi:MAG: tRNA (adenosine(37)-N6)-threonylcarbamoyltransferase complex dimerization subunit type 1 TsaB [Myxococcota bacterium]
MRVLSIDTSSETGGITILDNEQGKLYRRIIENTNRVAESIYSHLESSLFESGIRLSDIDILTTVLGPGSFTGLRVSLSVLKAFAMVLNKPLLGIETFKVMAYASRKVREAKNILITGNARRDELFIALYDNELNEKMPIRIIPFNELSNFIKEEDLLIVYRDIEVKDFIPRSMNHIQIDKDLSSDCAELSLKLYNSPNMLKNASDIEPVYVRNDIVRTKT